MLTIAVRKDAEGVKKYFKEHLLKGDYYTEQSRVQGKWFGKTADFLGLKNLDAIAQEDFSALADGLHPQTKKQLAIRKKKERIVCYDMVFSAPKSVSIMALTGKETRLLEAHEKAVQIAFEELEKKACTRVRKGFSIQADFNRVTGNLISAQFTHPSNRELDPQLHSHHVVFNTTYDPVEGRLKALDAFESYISSPLITEVYRNALAQEVRKLGYAIEPGRYTWRLKDVPLEIEKLFSKRSQQIDEAAEKLTQGSGHTVDTRGRAILALKTRVEKNTSLSEESLHQHQKAQLNERQIQALEALRERTRTVPLQKETTAPEIIAYAIDHVFARKSVVKRDVLLAEALKHSAGRVSLSELFKECESRKFLKRGDEIMTREERKREVDLIEFVRNGKRRCDELGEAENLSTHLTSEQRTAIQKLLQSKDQVVYLRGAAGVGKTFVLKELFQKIKTPILLTAPTSGASDKLREDGFKAVQTTQKLLLDAEKETAKNALWVVDEAGLLSTKQMESLFQKAKENQARILLVGDTRQHNSVEGGDALRLLEDYSVIAQAEISTIQRQTERHYREAIQALSKGKVLEGIQSLEKLQAFQELGDEKRPKAVAQEYVNQVKNGVKTLIVTPTWTEHQKVTEAVRQELKQARLLPSSDVKLETLRSLNFTSVQKTYAPHFTKDDYVSFHANSGPFKQGENWKVESIPNEFSVRVINDRQERQVLIPKQHARAFDVVKKETAFFAPGDLILMKANYSSSPQNRIPNGGIRKIERIDPDGTIHLERNQKLDPQFRHFTHGYAVTSQASQGKDATHVIVSIDLKTKGALSKNQFYVSSSRGRKSISLYAENKEALIPAISRSSARKLALEKLVREGILKDKLLRLRVQYQRSVEMGRDLLERAFVKFRREKIRKLIRMRNIEKNRGFEMTD